MKIKTLDEFRASFDDNKPPDHMTPYQKAMWYDGKGDWQRAHDIVEVMHDHPSAQIHAYLHRKEGDLSNAKYWYTQASARMPNYSLEQEWTELATQFL